MKKIVVVIFVILISVPLVYGGVYNLTGYRCDVELEGNFDTYENPELTWKGFVSGEYQSAYEQWLNANVITRGIYIKNYNQIRYSAFHLGNRIIGKDNNLFEDQYVETECNLTETTDITLVENQRQLEEYVAHLESVKEKLAGFGKTMLVYTTPSKARYFYEDIPLRYRAAGNVGEPGMENGTAYFKTLLNNTSIPYFDTEEVVKEDAIWPTFYSTGIHWSRPFEQLATVELVERLETLSEKEFRNIVLTELEESAEPYGRDTDVYDLLNLYYGSLDDVYYQYVTEQEQKESFDSLRMLVQGGSFAQGLFEYKAMYPSSALYYINYDNYMTDNNGYSLQTLSGWESLDLGACLDQVDFVVIELNEGVVSNDSSGFVAYLDEYLNTYKPMDRYAGYPERMDGVSKEGLEHSVGFYTFEEGFAWADGESCLWLQNEKIAEQGLEIEYTVSDMLLAKSPTPELTIYVNGRKVRMVSITEAGEMKIRIASEELTVNSDDTYEVELHCDTSFFPKEYGIEEDDRELSLQIQYVGERR